MPSLKCSTHWRKQSSRTAETSCILKEMKLYVNKFPRWSFGLSYLYICCNGQPTHPCTVCLTGLTVYCKCKCQVLLACRPLLPLVTINTASKVPQVYSLQFQLCIDFLWPEWDPGGKVTFIFLTISNP